MTASIAHVTNQPYKVPMLVWEGEIAEKEPIVWWIVLVGFSYAAALAWSAYCVWKGGSSDISFSWKGFKVTCSR